MDRSGSGVIVLHRIALSFEVFEQLPQYTHLVSTLTALSHKIASIGTPNALLANLHNHKLQQHKQI